MTPDPLADARAAPVDGNAAAQAARPEGSPVLRALPYVIAAVCIAWVAFAFDWHHIVAILSGIDLTRIVLLCVPAALVMFAARTIRWIAVSGLPYTPWIMYRVHAFTALSIATASPTPLQLGEIVKLKFTRDASGLPYQHLAAAYVLERMMDLAAVSAIAAFGLALRSADAAWAAILAIILVGAVAATPAIIPYLLRLPWGPGIKGRLAPLAGFSLPPLRLLIFSACTLVKWTSILALWHVILSATGIALSLPDLCILLASVTVSMMVVMVPAGIGVAELSARAVLIWLGIPPPLAEAGSIALRLISPLVIGLGLLQGIPILLDRKNPAAETGKP